MNASSPPAVLATLPERAAITPPAVIPRAASPAAPDIACPPAAVVAELVQSVSLGYYRGILNALADIERRHPEHAAFVHRVRPLAQQFQFDALGQILEHATP